jgi:hypothetical protein
MTAMINMELARELKVAGLPWRPQRGDLAMDRLNDPFVVVADGTDESGGVQIDTGRGLERRPFLGLTWIPRLDQLLAFLARHGGFDVAVRPAGDGRRDFQWRLVVTLPDGPTKEFRASDGGNAAGLALHYLLAERGWAPGAPLSRGEHEHA